MLFQTLCTFEKICTADPANALWPVHIFFPAVHIFCFKVHLLRPKVHKSTIQNLDMHCPFFLLSLILFSLIHIKKSKVHKKRKKREKKGGGYFLGKPGEPAGAGFLFQTPLPYPVFGQRFNSICFILIGGSAHFPKGRSRRFSGGCGGRKEKIFGKTPPFGM